MLVRLLAALAILNGNAEGSRKEATRTAREYGFMRLRGRSSGAVARALNLRRMPAYNEHFPAALGDKRKSTEWRRNRNAAKARRRALRAA